MLCRVFCWCFERDIKCIIGIYVFKEFKSLGKSYLIDVREFRDIENGGGDKIIICRR